MRPDLTAWMPRTTPVSLGERLRSALGALVGICATGLLSRWAVGSGSSLPVLIAPMGASAVLLFAVPSSPLAQPWSLIGGNLIAATVGVSAALAIPNIDVAAATAVGVAIALMMTCRCVHPPSGAVALTAVLGGHAVGDLGYRFVVWPVGANSLLLLGAALAFNKLVGRSYPHRTAPAGAGQGTADPSPAARVGFASADLDAVLADRDELLDIDRGDLEQILRQAEVRSWRRRAGQWTCAAFMSRNIVAIAPDAPIRAALDLIRTHHIKALPVTDENARVLGIVTQTDLLDKAAWDSRGPRLAVLHRIRLSLTRGRAPSGSVAEIMTAPVVSVTEDAVLADVVLMMARTGLHHLPVVDVHAKLTGIVSQADLIAALLTEAGQRGPGGAGPG